MQYLYAMCLKVICQVNCCKMYVKVYLFTVLRKEICFSINYIDRLTNQYHSQNCFSFLTRHLSGAHSSNTRGLRLEARCQLKCLGITFSMIPPPHTRGQVFLFSLGFIKRRLEIQKGKSTANASKKIKTKHRETFCTTHRHLSHP